MIIVPTRLSGLVLVEPKVFADARGSFFEAYRESGYAAAGISGPFVQDNVSSSQMGVLRGLHFQSPNAQGKLVQALTGVIWDVAVDLRLGSPTFAEWEAHELSSENRRQFFLPAGFAHGFLVLQGPALVNYKCTTYYEPQGDTTLRFDDPEVGVDWPTTGNLIISDKDRNGFRLKDLPQDRLPSSS
jgi:dTDP-4-dehydrorhamnose 3,5-epimerase